MLQLSKKQNKIITQKWTLFILISLRKRERISYKKISQISQIPTSTLSIRLSELVQCNFIEKFVYGSIRKPHNTDYTITDFGIDYLNRLLPNYFL